LSASDGRVRELAAGDGRALMFNAKNKEEKP